MGKKRTLAPAPSRTPLTNLTNNSPFQQQQQVNNLLFQQQQRTNNLQQPQQTNNLLLQQRYQINNPSLQQLQQLHYPEYSNFTEHLDEVTARCEAVCNLL